MHLQCVAPQISMRRNTNSLRHLPLLLFALASLILGSQTAFLPPKAGWNPTAFYHFRGKVSPLTVSQGVLYAFHRHHHFFSFPMFHNGVALLAVSSSSTLFTVANFFFLLFTGGGSSSCTSAQFKCNNGTCIPRKWVCDYQKDCTGGEDEQQSCRECPLPQCFLRP